MVKKSRSNDYDNSFVGVSYSVPSKKITRKLSCNRFRFLNLPSEWIQETLTVTQSGPIRTTSFV